MKIRHYILDENGNPKPASLDEWCAMFADIPGRTVKKEFVGDLLVSTVFLGLDHNWSGRGGPVLWETMVFQQNPDRQDRRFPRVELDGYTERCSGNREQAEAMHERVVALVKERQ